MAILDLGGSHAARGIGKEVSSQGTTGKTQDCKGIVCPDEKFEVGWICSDWEESKQSGKTGGTALAVLHQPNRAGSGYR